MVDEEIKADTVWEEAVKKWQKAKAAERKAAEEMVAAQSEYLAEMERARMEKERRENEGKVAKEYLSEEIENMTEVKVWINLTEPYPLCREIACGPIRTREWLGLFQLPLITQFLKRLYADEGWVFRPFPNRDFGIVAERKV